MCMDRTFEPETSVQHVMRVPAGISRSSRSANQASPEPASRTVTGRWFGARVPEDCPEEWSTSADAARPRGYRVYRNGAFVEQILAPATSQPQASTSVS